MKRIFFSLQALAIMIGAAGCHDALLNMEPESILTTSNYFKSSSEMNKAVIGIYSNLQARRQTDYIIMEAPSDNLYMSTNTPIAGAGDIDGLTVSPTTTCWAVSGNPTTRVSTAPTSAAEHRQTDRLYR